MKLILEHGQPQFGRFEHAPEVFNIEDYRNPFITGRFRKKLRYKKFSFIGVQHHQYAIGLAIADLSWLGHGFYYCYNKETEQYIDYHALQPMGWGTHVQEASEKAQFSYFYSSNINIAFKQNHSKRHVHVMRNNQVLCDFEIDVKQREPLYMCSPTGVRGWTFTHKSMCLPAKGYFRFAGEEIALNDQTLASLDDSCGFLRPETEWFWLSCQSIIADRKIGINIASGVNESVGNENCLWVDGHLTQLPDVIFEPLSDRIWKIYSLDGRIQLKAYTGWRRHEQLNAGLIASQFSQWVAVITGTIEYQGQQIAFENVSALLEQHYAKW